MGCDRLTVNFANCTFPLAVAASHRVGVLMLFNTAASHPTKDSLAERDRRCTFIFEEM
jgi:hypothetical protein